MWGAVAGLYSSLVPASVNSFQNRTCAVFCQVYILAWTGDVITILSGSRRKGRVFLVHHAIEANSCRAHAPPSQRTSIVAELQLSSLAFSDEYKENNGNKVMLPMLFIAFIKLCLFVCSRRTRCQMRRSCGCFVVMTKFRELRGCRRFDTSRYSTLSDYSTIPQPFDTQLKGHCVTKRV